ncbi:DUF3219 family protein [Neobacillus mesonae]|uniref:DUF3219 family protein n=1 Tax=Neobacillus mesonae TaxID=1193713 RepID=UPI0020421F46|nr:DUF3219 family protein [Neobacillus mesonae]MCM3567710.1 YkvR family protein [Neobacillus mesonae]
MVKEVILNSTPIKIEQFFEEKVNGLHKISITFNVTSEDYHDIATLLYEGTFDIKVPEKDLRFKAAIQQYYTSITNLYNAGEVGEYTVVLLEVKEGRTSCD